jgi:hypothetical protein
MTLPAGSQPRNTRLQPRRRALRPLISAIETRCGASPVLPPAYFQDGAEWERMLKIPMFTGLLVAIPA